jgi:hypothetical protein
MFYIQQSCYAYASSWADPAGYRIWCSNPIAADHYYIEAKKTANLTCEVGPAVYVILRSAAVLSAKEDLFFQCITNFSK